MIVSSGLATLAELQSVYGVFDCFQLAEVIGVDGFNRRKVAERGNSNR
jgi:hypothetical protein